MMEKIITDSYKHKKFRSSKVIKVM